MNLSVQVQCEHSDFLIMRSLNERHCNMQIFNFVQCNKMLFWSNTEFKTTDIHA